LLRRQDEMGLRELGSGAAHTRQTKKPAEKKRAAKKGMTFSRRALSGAP